MNRKQLKKFWNTIDPHFAHLEHNKFKKLTSQWESYFLPKLKFENKTVMDYGIGGGFLGKYLFESKKLGYYYGIDISKRSLEEAEKNLSAYSDKITLSLDNFSKLLENDIDIFVSQACIQHFPDEKYLKQFLKKLNNSKCKQLMLQIRHANKTIFNKDKIYKDDRENVRLACHTNKKYLLKHLTNYSLEWEGDVLEKTKYKYMIFKRNVT